ncbi:hypothetical protein BDW67DRAFT_32230 [Aspergillus spinulosporus]
MYLGTEEASTSPSRELWRRWRHLVQIQLPTSKIQPRLGLRCPQPGPASVVSQQSPFTLGPFFFSSSSILLYFFLSLLLSYIRLLLPRFSPYRRLGQGRSTLLFSDFFVLCLTDRKRASCGDPGSSRSLLSVPSHGLVYFLYIFLLFSTARHRLSPLSL